MNDLIAANKRRSYALIAGFIAVLVLVGMAVGALYGNGTLGTIIALIFSGVTAFVSYWKSDAIALRMSRAVPADPIVYKRLHNLVEGLCIAGGLPKPRIYVINDPAPNAFATGRNPKNAAVAVTTGLLEKMNRVELEGVVAHELSHIKNYDILVMTLAVTLVGAVALLTDLALRMMWWNGGRVHRSGDRSDRGNPFAFFGIILLIVAPLLARAMQAAVSRRRETLADVSAVQLTRYPPGLISALEKLQADSTVTHSASMATAHMWIEQPLSGVNDTGRLGFFHKLFNTHPPLADRIALLREI
ncbi:MAG: zinc metalloprotease HtpX [Actinobacteria bacterium]|nr:zinc metalloprotease HtpX [Actinomycetota bacterium]NBU06092.1 zinc metalloprotease HtpX [Acidimicrobiia bacterium]NBX12268.1 zinc metalloprotease HtpX [Acidimicrobiia bacterium]NDE20295.1 zinc metalloprotease HtpX [Actinomycetota bacterium]NDF67956.1 zinc metalloprotease HtpX [Actinomycetota bacterium]